MSEAYTGGPAFPVANDANKFEKGMTMRDYFAAKAMQAMIQARAHLPEDNENCYEFTTHYGVHGEMQLQNGDKTPPENFTWAELLAVESYEIADQMLKTREK